MMVIRAWMRRGSLIKRDTYALFLACRAPRPQHRPADDPTRGHGGVAGAGGHRREAVVARGNHRGHRLLGARRRVRRLPRGENVWGLRRRPLAGTRHDPEPPLALIPPPA